MKATNDPVADRRENTSPMAGLTHEQVERAYRYVHRKEQRANRVSYWGLAVSALAIVGAAFVVVGMSPANMAASLTVSGLLLAFGTVSLLVSYAARNSRWHVVMGTLCREYTRDVLALRSAEVTARIRAQEDADKAKKTADQARAVGMLRRSGVLDEGEK